METGPLRTRFQCDFRPTSTYNRSNKRKESTIGSARSPRRNLQMKDQNPTTPAGNGTAKPLNLEDILGSKYGTEFFKAQNLLRTDTPDTLMTEYTNKPDITVRCEKCGIFIDIRTLQDHRGFHNALALMKYKSISSLPDNAEALLKRRNAILRRLKSDATVENPVDPKAIKMINDAYERLKSDVEDTYDMCRQIRYNINTNVNGVALNVAPSCALAVGLCSSQNEKWKSSMEDTRVFQDYFGDDQDKCYLALFDGHHGRFAAEIAAAELHKLLLNEMAKFDSKTKSTAAQNLAEETDITHYKFDRPTTKDSEQVVLHQESMDIIQQIITLCEAKYELLMKDKGKVPESDDEPVAKTTSKPKHPLSPKIASAFKKVYHLLDILLSYGKDECSKVRWSGCSALTAVIHATNSGDSVKGSESSHMKEEEKDEGSDVDPPEQLGLIHLANAGNTHALLVRGNRPYRLSKDHTPSNHKERKRVLKSGGTLSESSRDCQVNGVIATTRGLGNHGDVSLKTCIQVEPSTVCVPIDQYAQFLVLATNGVWEIFSDQEVSSLLLKRLRKLQKMLPTHHVPPPRVVSSSLRPLLDELENNEKVKKEEQMRFGATAEIDGSRYETRNVPDIAIDSPTVEELDVDTESSTKQRSSVSQSEGDKADHVTSEGALATSTPIETTRKTGQVNVMTIEADMKTEIGSQLGDATDLEPSQDCDLINDHLTLPVHADIPNHVPETEEDKQRELAKNMAEYLVQAALMAGAKDNISVMVVLLPGCGL